MRRKLLKLFCKHPIITSSLAGASLFLTADVAAQQLILDRKDKHDAIATIESILAGLASGPILRSWYGFLERKIGPFECSGPAFNKMLLDQALFKPVFFGIPFLASDIRSLDNASETFNLDAYKDMMLNSYKFTPLLMFLTFRFVHPRNRVLATQVMGAVWWFAHTIKKEKGDGGGGGGGGGNKGGDQKGDDQKGGDKKKDDQKDGDKKSGDQKSGDKNKSDQKGGGR